MFQCPLCAIAVFDKRKDLDVHLISNHSENKTPYKCSRCPSLFSTDKAVKLHTKNKHQTQEEGSPDRKRKRDSECPFVGTLAEWVHARYNSTRATSVEHLCSSTITRVQAFAETLRFDEDQTLQQVLTLPDEGMMDQIDNFVDHQLQSYALQTVNNHVRYLRILLLFRRDHIDPPMVDDIFIDYISDLVADTQVSTTRASTALNMLKLEDPFKLAEIRDTIVNALLKEQVEYIHPYIMRSILPAEKGSHVDFGLRLRNWIELSIRFTNIPCRIQCSRELQMDGPSSYVCKLVRRDSQFARMIFMDKTASSHQPLLLPLGRSLSAYLFIYMTHCRPETDHNFVFCTRRGSKWKRPSRDLKRYLEDILNFPVHEIDPTGRFIHGSRSIMMACFGIGVNFDQQKMHGFARLMRHSSTTNERFYSMWQQRAISNQAIDVFAETMGLDFDSTTNAPRSYEPVRLRVVPPAILSRFLEGLDRIVSGQNIHPCYSMRSIGTQTGPETDVASTISSTLLPELDVSETQPRCPLCGLFSLALYGPYGSMRRKRFFARYYLACKTCHISGDGRFDLQRCLWYPLGFVPIQKSQSNTPRNIVEIQNYISNIRDNP